MHTYTRPPRCEGCGVNRADPPSKLFLVKQWEGELKAAQAHTKEMLGALFPKPEAADPF
jgi:hypothetical protein